MQIVLVAIRDSTRVFDKLYSYLYDETASCENRKIQPGIRVQVPFGAGNRPREAFVFRVTTPEEFSRDQSSEGGRKVEIGKLKHILKVLDEEPVMNGELMGLADFIRDRYICTYYDALRIMMPIFSEQAKGKTMKVASLLKERAEVLLDIEENRYNKIQHIRVLEILLENETVGVSDLISFAGVSRSVLTTLQKNGSIEIKNMEIRRDPFIGSDIPRTEPLTPTSDQERAMEVCREILMEGAFGEVLLHGVTGSGKTEVYLQLIAQAIEAGRNAIVLVPEISLTPLMVNRFKGRFGDAVAVLHSRLSIGERYDQWRAIREGKIRVVVGARSAIFAPFENIGIVVIDEVHETSYKSEITPKYEAAEIAKVRCQSHGALLIFGSATPSVDYYHRALSGELPLLRLDRRARSASMPAVEIVDMRRELEEGNREMFSRALSKAIEENIQKGEQTMLFMNRRGYASFMLCRDCGKAVVCKHCNVSMTYHLKSSRLICHYCGYTIPVPAECPSCNSKKIRSFGLGTQKIEEEVAKRFGCEVLRMDMDTTLRKNSHEEILRKFSEERVPILIGTQMIAKGHDFHRVTLVGVLAADGLLYTGDYRATERTFQLLTQVSGRAGRGDLPGRVLIQAYNVDHYSVLCATKHDYNGFYENEIRLRSGMGYPPFQNIGVLLVSGTDDAKAMEAANRVFESIRDYLVQTRKGKQVLAAAPMRAPISKAKDRFRWRIILKSAGKELLTELMTLVSDTFYKGIKQSDEELSVDMNPYNMS